MTTSNCDSCTHWDPNLVRYRGKPESLCLCQHSADYRRYVIAYHTCHWHSAIKHQTPKSPTGEDHA